MLETRYYKNIFTQQEKFISTKISVYLNKYGECAKGRSISDEYILNEDLLKNIISDYKNLGRNLNFIAGEILPDYYLFKKAKN